MINDSTGEFYELKIPYALFPKSAFLDFSTRIFVHSEINPCSTLEIPPVDTQDKIRAAIMVGEDAKLFSFIANKDQMFKELPFQQQMAVIYHELLHLLITYHQLMIPELARTENNSVTRFLLPRGFSNLMHDFIIDTIGSELASQKALLRITFDDFDLATWHYYTYLKAPPDSELNFTTSVQITDFWYGNYLEGRHYPLPHFFDFPDDLHPDLKQAYTTLEKEIQKAFDKVLIGITNVCRNIRNHNDGYTEFWNDEYLLAPWTEQRIILDTVNVVKEFNDDLEKIQQLATNLIPELGNLFDIAEQIDITIETGAKIPNLLPSIIDEIKPVTPTGRPSDIDTLQKVLQDIADKIAEKIQKDREAQAILDQILDSISKDNSASRKQVSRLRYSYYPDSVYNKVTDALKNLQTSTKLRVLADMVTRYHGYIAKRDQHSTRGKLDVREVVKQFPNIVQQQIQRPAVFEQTQVMYLPKLNILTVFDLSGSMNSINMVLKPFFSAFYQEGLSPLFNISMVDFSDSVVLENWDNLPKDAYYSEIENEGGTAPLAPYNLPTWKTIIEQTKPDAILVYSDGYFDPLLKKEDSMESLAKFFTDLGMRREDIACYKVDENYDLDMLIEQTLEFLNERVEEKYKTFTGHNLDLDFDNER